MITLCLSDAEVDISVRYAIIHLILWQALHIFNIKASTKHLSLAKVFSAKEHFQILTTIYNDVIALNPLQYDLFILKKQIFDSIFEYHNFILLDLSHYEKSISLMDLYQIMEDPQIKEIVDPPLNELTGTVGIEAQIKARSNKIFSLLSTPGALSNQSLLLFQQLETLNKDQLTQLLVAIGNRTDINEDVIAYTIQSSIIKGLKNPLDYAVDSLSGKKPIIYNKGSIRKSQYFGRQQHLIVSDLKYLYPDDCGTDKTVQFLITDKNKDYVNGKNIVENGQLKTITKNNIHEYLNQIVEFRSPLGCRHNDGVCKVCAGTLIASQIPDLHVGMNSSTQMVQEVTQKILSAKHLIKTSSIVYKIPKEVEHCFSSLKNNIYFTNDFMKYLKTGYFGIHQEDMGILSDLKLFQKNRVFTVENYSKIQQVFFKIYQPQTKDYKIFNFSMQTDQTIYPYLHKDFLLYMKDRFEELVLDDEIIWVPFKHSDSLPNWDIHQAVLSSVITNDNMSAFVKRINGFLSKKIVDYTNASKALRDFSNLIYNKSSVNIAHIEMVLRAYMITSPFDFIIPKNPDLNNCMFRSVATLLKQRSISIEISFERIFKFLTDPSTYTIPFNKSIFDIYYNI